ncbi:Translocator protein like protein [Daldinia childiae]|uniref:Translocator protein like protein n=1 Tax=Daldinia childiae TaxID=326645 RepID=UPI001447CF14|nr:Translocator protein like protein [Daldinia childiae]KAF3055600.1 Translocator protein like protein [Daldinia childiae]
MTAYIPRLSTIPYDVFANPAASILLPIALGTAVGFSSRPKQTQATYAAMKQPPLRPPPQVFGPVWTVLYGLMGYAAHRVVTKYPSSFASTDDVRALYSAQLGLNLLWMPLFFGLRKPVLALADIVSLVGLNGYLTYLYFSVDSTAGWCQLPYMVWLGFATYLTAGVGYLNNWDISEATLAKRI